MKDYLMMCLTLVWLILCSYQDVKRKQINTMLILIGAVVILAASFLQGDLDLMERLLGLTPGIILLLLSYITRGQIGIGDGLIICGIGICFGLLETVVLLAYGLFGSAIFAVIILCIHKADRKKTIPFVPFILLGYMGVMLFA
ncbi:MAG: peptidase prepilin type [Anaerocolumna sp.]|nr:peptidase prepilin type [Anaerocolumna sp.]